MKHLLAIFTALLLVPLSPLHAADPITLHVDSPAFVFSPGNWTGDEGRSGKVFRQTWNAGAYFRVTWESSNPEATLSGYKSTFRGRPRFFVAGFRVLISSVLKSESIASAFPGAVSQGASFTDGSASSGRS